MNNNNNNLFDLNKISFEPDLEELSLEDLGLTLDGIKGFKTLTSYFESKSFFQNKRDKKFEKKMLNDNLFFFQNKIDKIQKLTKEKEIQLFDKIRISSNKSEQKQILDLILVANLYLIKKYADQEGITKTDRMEEMDLIIEGFFGLVKAAKKYNYLISNRFMTYAPFSIIRSIRRAKFDQSRIIYLPTHINENLYKINKILSENRFIKKNDIEKIAAQSGIPLNTVSNLIFDKNHTINYKEVSEKEFYKILDTTELKEDNFIEEIDNKVFTVRILKYAISKLKPKEQKVIILRYGLLENDSNKKTLEEIGALFNLTRERIRQIEHKAIEKLKKFLHKYYYSYNIKEQTELIEINKKYNTLFKNDNGMSYIPDSFSIAEYIFSTNSDISKKEFLNKFTELSSSIGFGRLKNIEISLLFERVNNITKLKTQNDILTDENQRLLKNRKNIKIANITQEQNKETKSSELANSTQNKSLSEKILLITVNAIAYMNNIGCYTTNNTLLKLFKGIESSQTKYFSCLKDSTFWGIFKEFDKFDKCMLELILKKLTENKIISISLTGYKIIKRNND